MATSHGVYRTYWQGDLFANNRSTNPANLMQDKPDGVYEVDQPMMLD